MLLKKVWRKNYELYGDGCRYLAAIWEGAWKEGIRQEKKLPGKQKQLSMH